MDTSKPLLLDLFCGVGGASRGYANAGFDIIGVDLHPQPDYPYEFIQADALRILDGAIRNGHSIAAVHASPPCQASCTLTKGTNQGREYPQLIPAVRERLQRLGVPTVIENVQGSDLRRDLTLCGEMFGLKVIRHRWFEVEGFPVVQPPHTPHRGRVSGWRHGRFYEGPYVSVYGDGGGKGSTAQWQDAMGIDWTENRKSIAEAIPPAYTEFIGEYLMSEVLWRAAA